MNSFLEALNEKSILVSDGAMGTMLMAAGMQSGDCPEALNLSRPELIRSIARDYARAGADLVETNSFGGSPAKLAIYGQDDKTEQLNRLAAELARAAVGEEILVAGSCGPTGLLLEPCGPARPTEIQAWFQRQIQGLIDGDVDVIFIETMTDPNELQLAIDACREVDPGMPIVASMTFDATPNGFFTMMGTAISDAVAAIEAAQVDMIGSNCGHGLENMIAIATEISSLTDLPLMIQSNAGLPVEKDGGLEYGESPQFFAANIDRLMKAKVKILGGCCGTTPDHIRAIRKHIDSEVNHD